MTKTCENCNLSYDTDEYGRCPVCEPRKRYVCPECGEKYNSEDCPVCYGGFFNKVFEFIANILQPIDFFTDLPLVSLNIYQLTSQSSNSAAIQSIL